MNLLIDTHAVIWFITEDDQLPDNVKELIEQSGLTILPITTTHILTNSVLDFHHRDPFDRLIIAQAKSEGLTLLSKDGEFENYNINLMWKE